MKKHLLFVLFLFVCCIACDKNDDDPEINTSDVILLPSVIVCQQIPSAVFPEIPPTVTTRSFEYDSRQRIIAISTVSDNGQGEERVVNTLLSYEENKVIATITSAGLEKDRIVREFVIKENEVIIDGIQSSLIKIDEDQRVVSYDMYWEQPEDYTVTYTYDNKGNAASRTSFLYPGSDRFTVYQFTSDDANGVFRHVKTPAWFLTTQLDMDDLDYLSLMNNCIRTTVEDYLIFKYEYTYNRENYPVNIVRDPVGVDGSGGLKYEIEYKVTE